MGKYAGGSFWTAGTIVVGFLLLMRPVGAVPDEEWNRTFGGRGEDWINSVQLTSDGGYILAGQSAPKLSFKAWLIKTDGEGTPEWNKTFTGSGPDRIISVLQTSDGGYILCGATSSYGDLDSDAWLIKTDTNGTQEWYKTFGGKKDDSVNSVQPTSDGGYILSGRYSYGRDSYGGENTDAWIIKTDINGSMQWSKKFGDDEEANSVQQTSDGGYVFVGSTRIYLDQGRDKDAYLIKTDTNGDKQWKKAFGETQKDAATSVRHTSDGGYVIAGYTNSYGNGSSDAWLIKIDSKGDEQWSKTFGGEGDDRADSVLQTSDGGYVLAGRTEPYWTRKPDSWIIKTDGNGNELWKKTFGGAESDWASSVEQTADGGYILAGVTYSYGNGSADGWIIKVSGESPSVKTTLIPATSAVPPPGATTPADIHATTSLITPAITALPPATTTHTQETPGFEGVSAIACMLIITFLIRKREYQFFNKFS